MTIKVVINTCYGGFDLSDEAEDLVEEKTGKVFDAYKHPRHCPVLVSVVEELGPSAAGRYTELAVVKLKGNRYIIDNYDGLESVIEPEGLKWIEVKQ